MKITKDEIQFLKRNNEMLEALFKKRKEDFIQALLIEKDPIKSEAFKLVIREWDNWLFIKKNIAGMKEPKKGAKKFTGV